MGSVATTISSDDRELWLATRRKYIGASEVPALLGIDPFRSSLDVYLDKRGVLPEREMTSAMEAGLELEDSVLRWYGRKWGKRVVRSGVLHLSDRYTWAACTPDGFEDGAISIQVKCTGRTDAWDEQIPPHVYAQVQSEMMVLGTPEAVALALVSTWGGFDLRPYRVGRDDALIERIAAAGEDMARRVADGDPPPPDGSDAAARAVKLLTGTETAGEVVTLGIDAAEQTARVRELDAEIKRLEKEREALRQGIALQIGSAEVAVLPGGGSWTFRTVERAGYTVQPTSYRQLRLVKGKAK